MTEPTSTPVQSTGFYPRRRAETGAQSQTAWERVLDQLRTRLKRKPTRSAVFGRAGLRSGKGHHMRKYPDLRASVIVKLARALRVSPGKFLDMMVEESWTDSSGEIHF